MVRYEQVANSMHKFKQQGLIQIIFLIFLLLGIAATVFGIKYARTILKSKASESPEVFSSRDNLKITQNFPFEVYISLCRNDGTNSAATWQVKKSLNEGVYLYDQNELRCNEPVPNYLTFTQNVPAEAYLTLCAPGEPTSWVWQVDQSQRIAVFKGSQEDVSCAPRNKENNYLIQTGDKIINDAIPLALSVLRKNYNGQYFIAGSGHPDTWLRDNLDFGLVPNLNDSVLAAYINSIGFWASVQERGFPIIPGSSAMNGDAKYDSLEPGQISTSVASGYYDESLIFISAVLEAYQISGDEKLLSYLKNCRDAWSFAKRYVLPKEYLIYAKPYIASDWADQIKREGYALNIETLWYKATKDLAQLEHLAGNANKAEFYKNYAEGIKREINSKLYRVSIPRQIKAPYEITNPFGHYIAWTVKKEDKSNYEADYFELDGNLRAILFGIADNDQTQQIMDFVNDPKNFEYLMGKPKSLPPATKVLFGNYDPADYAFLHSQIGDGLYHNQYWINVGAIAAEVYSKLGNVEKAKYILQNMSTAFNSEIGVSEWYRDDGTPAGSQWYQWPARAFLVSLFRGWAGINHDGLDLVIYPPAGNTSVYLTHMGKKVTYISHYEGDNQVVNKINRIVVDGTEISGNKIQNSILRDGSVIDVYSN